MSRESELAAAKPAVLRIGREPDNDFVINLPIVSGYHARVSWEGKPGQGVIEDLGSSNGTAIGSIDRKVTRSAFSTSETIYFGNHPVPAAELLARVDPSVVPALVFQGAEMVIGRDPGCHRVIDLVTVSSRHARLKRSEGRIFIEDLGSSNGTFVNGLAVAGPTEVKPGDLIGLGRDSFRLALNSPRNSTQRISSIEAPNPSKPAPASTMKMEPNPIPETAAPGIGGILGHPLLLLALLIQAPILAVGIALVFGGKVSSPMPSEASVAVASVLFWLGLASLWFGLSDGVLGMLLDPNRPQEGTGSVPSQWWLGRLGVLGTLCLAQCVLARLIAFPIAGMQGPALPTLGLLILGSCVGLAMGFVIVLSGPRRLFSWVALGLVFVSLWLFGGGPWSLPRSNSVARMVSNAAPSRWAFEGLLLSESDHGPKPDVAEAYFPAETDRMGPKADAMALGAMLIGLLGTGAFLVKSLEKDPSAPSTL